VTESWAFACLTKGYWVDTTPYLAQRFAISRLNAVSPPLQDRRFALLSLPNHVNGNKLDHRTLRALILAAGGEIMDQMTMSPQALSLPLSAGTKSGMNNKQGASTLTHIPRTAQFLVFGDLEDVKDWLRQRQRDGEGEKVKEMMDLMRDHNAQLVTSKVSIAISLSLCMCLVYSLTVVCHSSLSTLMLRS
jgi:hypothetical protein